MSRFVRGRKGLASIADDEVLDLLAELATLREQVRTLREALVGTLTELREIKEYCVSDDAHDPDCENTLMQGDWFRKDSEAVARMEKAAAALAATEPKG